ncbi:MAG: protease modulator HflC [Alphaproteobacteria bacterium]|nr:MAG: protease modulator HflC [Alphaproteobacteria bacterium]
MSPKFIAVIAVVLILGFLGLQSVYTVHQTKQAIVLQFGETVQISQEPGLYFKLPLIQNVILLDNRLLLLDQAPEEIVAQDQERLIVDVFARFQIINPLNFYRTVNNEANARQRLSRFLNSNMRRVLGSVVSTEIVSGDRNALMELIEQGVNNEAESAGLGIAIRDVRIKRVDLPQANSQAVYERMRSERQQLAAQYRAVGEERARTIRAQAERRVTVTLARAREDGEIKRGHGDALRNAIFACAFGADPDFFSFYRSMQAYEQAFQSQDTTMVLSPDSEFFQFFGNAYGARDVREETIDRAPAPRLRSSDPRCSPGGSYDLSDIDFLAASAPTVETDPLDAAPEPEIIEAP